MSNAALVTVLEQCYYLCYIEDLWLLVEFVHVGFNKIDELSSLTVLQNKVQARLVLKGVFEWYDARVLDIGQQLLLN